MTLHISQAEGDALLKKFPGARVSRSVAECLAAIEKPAAKQPPTPRGPRKKSRGEILYAKFLETALAAGTVQYWEAEPWLVVLAERTTYRPDFFVVLADGTPVLVEIKGHFAWDDAKVKFKVARKMFPEYRWLCLEWKGGVWRVLFKNGREPAELISRKESDGY